MIAAVRDEVPLSSRDEVEVATVVADELRASIRVTGTLNRRTVPLLTSVVSTHLSTGRRYLRVDLAGATVDALVIDFLVRSHRSIQRSGGMLVFENAGPVLIDAIRDAQLFVTTP